ncbi:hypothetical protein GHT06_007539 [Daphnia sinensis]|uniref:Uncharacterized protein n=1 Tax=Daphnia sinensis TaxID=1820382 RepID=A0AAD5KE60_9CRUS|nr:hypothetical protein GHT06_007539 [Daphnia sinensis]
MLGQRFRHGQGLLVQPSGCQFTTQHGQADAARAHACAQAQAWQAGAVYGADRRQAVGQGAAHAGPALHPARLKLPGHGLAQSGQQRGQPHLVGGMVFFAHWGLLALALKGGADEPARQPLGRGHAADEAAVAVDRKRRQQLALGLVQVGPMAKTDLPAQGVQWHGKTGQRLQQSQAVKGTGHDQPRGLAQGLALRIGHGPCITAPLNALHLLAPAHLHTRGLQLRGHQSPGPNPARLRMPQRGRACGRPAAAICAGLAGVLCWSVELQAVCVCPPDCVPARRSGPNRCRCAAGPGRVAAWPEPPHA